MIIVSILIYILFTLFATVSIYGRVNFAQYIQLLFLVIFGFNITIYFGLNLFKAINQSTIFLIFQLVICLILSLLIRHRWPLSIKEYRSRLEIGFSEFKWFDFVLIFLIGSILSVFFVVGISTPPNNLDSLDSTGITRIFYWLQQHDLSWNVVSGVPQIFDPKFLHIQGLWLFSLGKSEFLFFLVQWFSLLVSTITLFKISRSLKFSITNSLLSALIGLSFPIVLMQTYSFQGDLIVAVLIFVCISFVLDWCNSQNLTDIVAACLSLVFALGTKKAAFLALPAIGLFLLYWLITRIKNRKIIPWAMGSLAVFILSFVFVISIMIFKHGGNIAGISIIYDRKTSVNQIIEKTKYNASRFFYQFVGLDGLPRSVQNKLIPIKAEVFQKYFMPITLNLENDNYLQPGFDQVEEFRYQSPLILSEESAWFGPIIILLVPLALLLSLFSKQKNRRIYAIFGIVLFVSFFIMVILQRPGWDPYQGRYFILPILPLIPLLSILFPSAKIWRTIVIILILPVCLFLSLNTFFANNSRPIITAGSIWGFQYHHILNLPENNKYELFIKNKLTTSFDQIATAAIDRPSIYQCSYWGRVYYSGFRMLGNISFIDPLIPDESTVYLDLPSSALDYGLFGRYKDRKLIRIDDFTQLKSGYFLTQSSTVITQPNNIKLVGDNGTYKIFEIKNEKPVE
jgi:hypothetical protein